MTRQKHGGLHRSYEISISPRNMWHLVSVQDPRTGVRRRPTRHGTCYEFIGGRSSPCPGCPVPAAVLAVDGPAFVVAEVEPHGQRARVDLWHVAPSVLKALFEEKLRRFAVRSRLSARELQMLRGMTQSGGADQIAARVGISVRTVRFHVRNLFRKTHVHSRLDILRQLLGLVNHVERPVTGTRDLT